MKLRLATVLLLLLAISAPAAEKKNQSSPKPPPPATGSVIGAFHINKDEWLMLVQFKTNPENADTIWEYDEQKYQSPSLIAAMPRYADKKVLYRNQSGSGEIKVRTQFNHKKFYNLDHGIKLFAPVMVRRGAPISLFAECFSRWELDLTLKWERKVSRELPGMNSQSKDLQMFVSQSAGSRFSPGEYYQEKMNFSSLDLPVDQEWNCAFLLSMPGKLLLENSVRFIPIGMLPELSVNQEGNFTDKSGRIVVPVINENKLAEQRKWEFFRAIRRYFLNGQTLIIAPEMGKRQPETFSRALTELDDKIDFHAWPENNCTSQAVADVLNHINRTDAETLALILPPQSLRIGGDLRWAEYTRLLVSAAWSRPQMRKVLVITLPAPVAAMETEQFMRCLREIPRASDTELLELDCAGYNWDKKNIFRPVPDAQSESSSLPHGAIDKLSRIIMEHIR